MKHSNQKLKQILCGLLLAGFGLSAFAADSTEEAFPDIKSTYLKTGDFIGIDHVQRVTPGLTKDQVRLELGNPHFSEGIFGVKTWNYVFNFYKENSSDYITCQYKVKYDAANHVASTHWKDRQCEDLANATVKVAEPAPAPAPAVAEAPAAPVAAAPAPVSQKLVLEESALFAFGKSGINDLLPEGRSKLEALVGQIKQDDVKLSSVVITGHADSIGASDRNLALSQARADSVAQYLEFEGIDGKVITTNGAGETNPVVTCDEQGSKKELIACLQPNRRVEIEIKGTK